MIKQWVVLLIVLFSVSGCNTVKGLEKDLTKAGKGIEKGIEKTGEGLERLGEKMQ